MIRTDLLRSIIVQNRLTQQQVAQKLGMTTRTFYKRMRCGIFRSDEMEMMMDMLHITDPREVFFVKAEPFQVTINGTCL